MRILWVFGGLAYSYIPHKIPIYTLRKNINSYFDFLLEMCPKKEGIKIYILKLESLKQSDEEIDYAFSVCKVLGTKGISMGISKKAAKRGPIC